MKKEIRLLFTALMFFTRLPVPHYTDHSPEYLKQSPRYFPLIGYIVGAICGITFLVFYHFFSLELSLLASMITGVLTTGAFHEDGFADVCDAFGGGWTKEKILEIMKDSRLGTYGTIGLISMLSAKFLLLRELLFTITTKELSWILILGMFMAAHAISRLMSVISIQFYPYVREDASSKSKPSAAQPLTTLAFMVAAIFALLPFSLLPLCSLNCIPVLLLATFLLNRYFTKWIGGHTGDCLGTVQQVTEILCYITILQLWRFI